MTLFFNVNLNTGTDSAGTIWFALKQHLKTAGWQAMSSGDGLSLFSSSGDILVSGGSGAGGMKNDFAWIRLKATCNDGYNREMLLQYRNSSGERFNVTYSAENQFVVGSPSATSAPTATDEAGIQIAAAEINTNPWKNTTSAMRYHLYAGDAADGYVFGAFAYPAGGGSLHTALIFDQLQSGTFSNLDRDPYMFCYQTINAAGGNNGSIPLTRTAMSNNTQGWIAKGAVSSGFKIISAMEFGDRLSGTYNSAIKSLGPNHITGNDDLLPVILLRRPGTPFQVGSPPFGYKGVSKNIKMLGSATRTVGDTFTINTTRDYIVVGDYALPWDGSLPSV